MTIDLVVKMTVALGLALVAARSLSRASAASRHVVLMCGLLSVLWLPLAATVTPTLPLPVLRPETASQRHNDAPASAAATAATSAPVPFQAAPAQPVPTTTPTRPWPWILIVWAVGAMLAASRTIWGRLLSRRLLRQCRPHTDDRIVTMTRTIAHELRIARSIKIIEAPSDVIPATWGLARPVLLLPACAREWDDDRLRLVLMHELSHIARLDALASTIAHIATALAWWHPLAWVASRQAQLERERACDDAVLRTGVAASAYASLLLDVARSLTPVRHATTAMARPHGLERRLAAILDTGQRRAAASRLTTIVAAMTLVLQIPIAAVKLESQPVWPDMQLIEVAATPIADARTGLAPARESQAPVGTRTPDTPPAQRQAAMPNFSGHWRMTSVPGPTEYSSAEIIAPIGDEFIATQDGSQLAVEYLSHATFSSGRASGRGSLAQVRLPDQLSRAVFRFDGAATNQAGWSSGVGAALHTGPNGTLVSTGSSFTLTSRGEGWDNAWWDGQTLNVTSTKVTNGVTTTSTRRLHLDGTAIVIDVVEDSNTASPVTHTTCYVRASGSMIESPNGTAVLEGRFGAGAYYPGAGIPAPYKKPPYVEPAYTDDAKRAGIEGYVEIEAVVDTDGRVSQARIAHSLDAQLGLDDNALDVVRRSTFRPCMGFGNTPLPCLVTFEVAYF